MNSTQSRLEHRLARLLASTSPPTVPSASQPKAKVDFVYLTEADQDRLDDAIRQ